MIPRLLKLKLINFAIKTYYIIYIYIYIERERQNEIKPHVAYSLMHANKITNVQWKIFFKDLVVVVAVVVALLVLIISLFLIKREFRSIDLYSL